MGAKTLGTFWNIEVSEVKQLSLTKDTPLSELYSDEEPIVHSENMCYVDVGDDEIFHWKYIKREKLPNGKWRYYYDWDELKKDAKEGVDKAADSVLETANKASKKLNSIVDKAKSAINNFFDDPDNKYDISSSSYARKVAEIKETKEWKDIVASGDKEYVKKNEDGTTTYLIDDYIVDKKHPILDALGDIAAGRKVSINEITKESTVAGLKDQAMSCLRTGMMAVTVMSTFLTEKFKLQQGSYDDKVESLMDTARNGEAYVDDVLDVIDKNKHLVSTMSKDALDIAKTTTDFNIKTLSDAASSIDPEIVKRMVSAMSETVETKKNIDEGNVVKAAQVIMQSELLQETLGDNEYYKMCEATLSNLSETEIAALNLLLKQLRTRK